MNSFQKTLDTIGKDIDAAFSNLFTWMAFYEKAKESLDYLEIINGSPWYFVRTFWTHQHMAVINIGKPFDGSKDVHSFLELKKHIKQFKIEFKKENFKVRKAGLGVSEPLLTTYISESYDFRPEDFEFMIDAIDSLNNEYKSKIGLARHKLFAHSAKLSLESLSNIQSHTDVYYMEAYTEKIKGLQFGIWNAYINGYKFEFHPIKSTLKENVFRDVGIVLDIMRKGNAPRSV